MTTTEQRWGAVLKYLRAVCAALVLPILSLLAVGTTATAQAQKAEITTAPAVAPTKLIDPTTKNVIGSYDPKKAVLVFGERRNMEIPRKLIVRVSAKENRLLMQRCDEMKKTREKYMKPLTFMMKPQPHAETATGSGKNATVIVDGVSIDGMNTPLFGAVTGGEDAREGSENCAGLCWSMAEGGASCTGCCRPVSKDACYCWEQCSDVSSAIGKGNPAK
jgi:hypothetical protein